MKFILLSILATMVIFFVWNILKRIFFTQFYNHINENNTSEKKVKKSQKVNWDAETIDFEEVDDHQKK